MPTTAPYFKYTMFFDYKSNTNVDNVASNDTQVTQHGGWTESVLAVDQTDSLISKFKRLMQARAGLLPVQTSIIAFRISRFETRKGSRIVFQRIPGTVGINEDVPQMALMATGYSQTNNLMRYIARGLPDDWVKTGTLQVTNDITRRLSSFFNLLGSGDWYQRVRDLAAPIANVKSITAGGLVTLQAPGLTTLTTEMKLRILKTITPERRLKGGAFKIDAVTSPTSIQLFGWDTDVGLATTGGTARIDRLTDSYYQRAMDERRAIVKKIGKPFFQYRGRLSARR